VTANSTEPVVSVVVPVYNTETVLKICLDSLVKQTLTDIEIIVVNDASTDGSNKIIESYAATDSRFRVLENNENQNSFETRKRGFAAARGTYITTCDSDDYMPRAALERLYEIARKEKADIVHGRMNQFSGARRWGCPWASPFKVYSGRTFLESLLRFGRAWNLYAKLYHRSVVGKGLADLPANKRLFCADDLLFSFFFGLQARRYAGCPEIVYHYRSSHDNFFKQPEKWASHIADHFYVLARMKERLEKNDLPAEYALLFKRLVKKTVAGVFANLPPGADLALARGLITEQLGKSYLAGIYGPDFSRSPLGNDYETAGNASQAASFLRLVIFPGRLIIFAWRQVLEIGFYEFKVNFQHLLNLIRRKGCQYAFNKLRPRVFNA
jgi:glycosyltransferase involved in cell wall biosynthesis